MLGSMKRLLLAGTAVAACAGLASAQLPAGSFAPEIEAKEWFNASEAGTTMEELRGKVVLVDFWATW